MLTVQHVSIRGIREVFAALGLRAPGNSTLVAWVREAGAAARRLMQRANTQLRPRVECLAGDDIFFHREAVKVLMEPVDAAVLEVLRWPDRSAESWQLWLADWPAHKLFVSDLGTDLTGATDRDQRPHQADLFHEGPWWREHIFEPLSRIEQKRAKEALHALDRATRPEGPGRRLSAESVAKVEAARAEAEAQFFLAVKAEERLRELFEPLDPEGRRWTDDRVEDVLQEVCELLVQLPDAIGQPTWMHLHRHRHRWCAHRVLWDSVEVVLRDGATKSREQVLDVALAVIAARRRERGAEDWATARAAQLELETLERELASQCANGASVMSSVKSLLRTPRRSSSLVEAFNSTLRVLQMLHRNVSDGLLGLHALAWNLRPRREGRRRGASPYARLGVDFASAPRPWYDRTAGGDEGRGVDPGAGAVRCRTVPRKADVRPEDGSTDLTPREGTVPAPWHHDGRSAISHAWNSLKRGARGLPRVDVVALRRRDRATLARTVRSPGRKAARGWRAGCRCRGRRRSSQAAAERD